MMMKPHYICYFLLILSISVALATGGTGPPRISNRDFKTIQVLRLGQEFRVTCPVEGDNVMVEWHKDGESITPAWTRVRINSRGLRIRSVNLDDAGIYQCKGVNGFGSQIARIRLVVADPTSESDIEEPESISMRKRQDSNSKSIPMFTQETLDQAGPMHLSAGNAIRFRCETKDHPSKVIWLKDGRPVGDKRTSWTLVLNKLVASDTGNYTCLNVGTNDSVNIQLLVTEMGEDQKPELALGHANNTSVVSGHEAVLECVIQDSGNSVIRPHIKWLKKLPQDQPIVPPTGKHKHNKLLFAENQHLLVIQETDDDSIRINVTEANGTIVSKLIFARTEPSDDATYFCLATNNFGFSFKEANLTVLVGAEIMSSSSSLIPFPLIVIGMSLIVAIVVIAAACSLRRQDHLPKQTKSISPRQLSNPSINYYKGFEQRQLLVSTSTHSSSTSSGGGGGTGEKLVCQTKLVTPGVAMAISRCSCCAQEHKNQEISALQTYDQCFNNSFIGSSTSHSLHCGHWT